MTATTETAAHTWADFDPDRPVVTVRFNRNIERGTETHRNYSRVMEAIHAAKRCCKVQGDPTGSIDERDVLVDFDDNRVLIPDTVDGHEVAERAASYGKPGMPMLKLPDAADLLTAWLVNPPTDPPAPTPDKPAGFWDDAEIIDAYSRADAIRSGALVDVTEAASETGFKAPVALTRAAWEDCVAWDEADEKRKRNLALQDQRGRLTDVLWMAWLAATANKGQDRTLYTIVRIPPTGRGLKPRKVTLLLTITSGDNGEPVFTIQEPHER